MSGETTATNATQRGKTIKMVHNYSWFLFVTFSTQLRWLNKIKDHGAEERDKVLQQLL